MSQLLKELNEKLDAIITLSLFHQKQVMNSPKGTVVIKEINDEKYYYLTYRHLNKVKTKYLGKSGQYNPEELQDAIALRQHSEATLKQLKHKKQELQAAIKAVERYNKSHPQ